MGDIQLSKTYLVAIWLESVFYGVNLAMFCGCLFVLHVKRRTSRVNRVRVAVATALFSLSSAHVGLGLPRLIEGFIVLRNTPGGPVAFFSDESELKNAIQVGIHTANSIISNGIMVWRCYCVWNRDCKMCILPILLAIASAVCGFEYTVELALSKKSPHAFAHTVHVWKKSSLALSLATSLSVTSLIAIRTCYILRVFGQRSMALQYSKAFIVVVESGMICALALGCEITLFFMSSNAFYLVYNPIAQLTAIVPTTIIILAGLELTSNDLHARLTDFGEDRSGFENGLESKASAAIQLDTILLPVGDEASDVV
ncbi:hypothetical protein EIP91_004648 [Steccherinum ochraceum]|uniref:Uncharacterized protein n=1 Tax=Steccherinum ochraceum TaxID=92696 RepID=A0A4R0RZW0_9APHY|nr:hypothetical protein EIP91_004648 [Steccherinum ochraceum]